MIYWQKKVGELCGIDIRSLALFRIGLALTVLGDLFIRMQDITAHYTDWGVLPRDMLIAEIGNIWHISLHLSNGTAFFQLCLFFFAALSGIALLFGYRTRLATLLSWLLLISLHSRNPLILQGGDIVLRLLLFWAMFLPLGACWSIDAWQNQTVRCKKQIVSVATLALLLQVCFIYWFSALLKTDASWRQEGSALWYALNIEQFSTSLGLALLQFPALLKILTFAVFYLEALGPFLAFSPICTGPLRLATALIFILFHLVGINLTMDLGHFAYVCAVAWLVFIPGWFWEQVLKADAIVGMPWKTSRLSNGLSAIFIGYIFLWNVRSLSSPPPVAPSYENLLGSLLRIDQYWNMFAPYPIKEDGWYIIPAKLRNGEEVDLYRDGLSVSWEKPPLISATYKSDRWRAYMMTLFFDENNAAHLLQYARFLCRQWNENHPSEEQLATFDIVFMMKTTEIDTTSPIQKISLWHHQCF